MRPPSLAVSTAFSINCALLRRAEAQPPGIFPTVISIEE